MKEVHYMINQPHNPLYPNKIYSGMSVDPASPTTFWFTEEYYLATSDGNWTTRIAAFTFGNVFSLIASASPALICTGSSAQLDALAYGGSGNYTYSWTSLPAGFTSWKIWQFSAEKYKLNGLADHKSDLMCIPAQKRSCAPGPMPRESTRSRLSSSRCRTAK